MKKEELRKLKIKAAISLLLGFPAMIILFFWPAGTLKWFEGWLCIILLMLFVSVNFFGLSKNDPELLKKRLSTKLSKRLWDRIISLLMFLPFLSFLIIAGFDAVRYKWSSVSLLVEAISFVVMIFSLYLIVIVMRENTFLSRQVEIQKSRHHKVITTGPYRYVRHPMYIAFILYMFSMSLALGSLYGLIPAAMINILLVIRTYFEDKMLFKELKGYKRYARKTKFRLVPGVW